MWIQGQEILFFPKLKFKSCAHFSLFLINSYSITQSFSENELENICNMKTECAYHNSRPITRDQCVI